LLKTIPLNAINVGSGNDLNPGNPGKTHHQVHGMLSKPDHTKSYGIIGPHPETLKKGQGSNAGCSDNRMFNKSASGLIFHDV
jgi:hypothetical protein